MESVGRSVSSDGASSRFKGASQVADRAATGNAILAVGAASTCAQTGRPILFLGVGIAMNDVVWVRCRRGDIAAGRLLV